MSYSAVGFNKVFDDVVRASGRPLSVIDALSADDQERYCDLINQAVETFWETGFWPGTFVVEQRTFDTDSKSVSKEESGLQTMGLIEPDECFYFDEPEAGSLRGVLDQVEDRGDAVACFDAACPEDPWVRYQLPIPIFTRVAYAVGTSYEQDEVCYDAATPGCYRSLQDDNVGNALTDSDWWELVEFPKLARSYVKWSASSELMSEDDGKYKQRSRARRELEDLEDRYLPVRPIGR